ncbi:MAG: prepilin-type N-terminal cleavage/methylation domain-containing protein [Verrucomicrobia bacterium]|nr:prepilin-type N-terminal cleavage/methylation domain-containing protein [Verrucomicrobiota bacterium]
MRTRDWSNPGFTLIEIMIVVAIIGLILAIAIPNFNRYRLYAQQQLCIENLSQIDNAKQQWALEKGMKDGDVPTETDLSGANGWLKAWPTCPAGGIYSINAIGAVPTCTVANHTY